MQLIQYLVNRSASLLPENIKDTAMIQWFGLTQIPLIFIVNPKVVISNDNELVVKIPLNFINKNHLGSMYFGTLAIGAEITAGATVLKEINKNRQHKISIVFQDFNASFYKRAESDVYFYCNQVKELKELIQKTINTKQRESLPVRIIARTPDKTDNETIASFQLTVSVKARR